MKHPFRAEGTHTLSSTAAVVLAIILTLGGTAAHAADTTLPTIGGTGGGLISEQQEAEIGRQVLQSIRSSTPRITDPLVYEYLSSVIYRLVPAAPLQDRNLSLVLIDNSSINAFAVPGGVVGVNGGLFLNARTEQQFAAVLAHELAHLSQRHFARRMEQMENSTPLTLAGMLAGVILSAVTQSDIGIATIAGTQALTAQNMLAYSRANEKEADRIGMEILASAGMDPRGMPEMFEIMMRQNRLQGNQVPEYLSTHPLTQSRVADTHNRAEQYPPRKVQDDPEFHFMRARLQVHYAASPQAAVDTFRAWLEQQDVQQHPAIDYGLAVALLANDQAKEAETILRDLLAQFPGRITLTVTLAETLIAQDRITEARELLAKALARNPGNYPITYTLAKAEIRAGDGQAAADHLKQLTRNYPELDHLWLRLAEAEGLARNIVGVHQARAEYEVLMGDLKAAQRQLRQAQEKLPAGSPTRQAITERLSTISRELARQRRS